MNQNINNKVIPILHNCVSLGNIDCIRGLIECDYCSVNDLDNYGRTALFICALEDSENSIEIAKFLLDCGIDINVQANGRWYNWTVLHTACYYNNKNLVKLLLDHSVNYELKDVNGKNAYQIADEMKHAECMEYLASVFENEGAVSTDDIEKDIQEAIFNGDYDGTKACLDRLGTKVKYFLNSNQTGTQTYLYRVCRNGNAKIVKLLLDYGAIARPHFYTKYSPLYVACHTGNIEIASLLLDKFQYLINIETIENFLPIHAACSQGHLNLVKYLLNYNYTDDLLNVYDAKILHPHNDHKETTYKYLFAFDLNSLDCNEQSILYNCIINATIDRAKKVQLCKLLLNFKVKLINRFDLSLRKKCYFKLTKLQKLLRKFQYKNIDVKQYYANTSLNSNHVGSRNSNSSLFDQLKSFVGQSNSYSSSLNAATQIDENLNVKFTNNHELDFEDEKDLIEDDVHSNDNSLNTQTTTHDHEHETSSEAVYFEEYFNPLNVNKYSKFGLTCLHEAVRQQNKELCDVLLAYNANINLPILDSNTLRPVSNCFIEILRNNSYNEGLFVYLFQKYLSRVNEDETISSTIKFSIEFVQKSEGEERYESIRENILPLLIAHTTRVMADKEYKLPQQLQISDYNGLYLNLSDFEPKLIDIPDKWLNKICNEFNPKYDTNFLTRLDLSKNQLKSVNPSIFQLKNLKQLKLNENSIETLNNINFNQSSTLLLEDLDLSTNSISEIPAKLFLHLKSLKHLNSSQNKLSELPFSIWQCKSLLELNLAFNQLMSLPFKCKNYNSQAEPENEVNEKNSRSGSGVSTISDYLNPQNAIQLIQPRCFIEKPLIKVNVWNKNSEFSYTANMNDNLSLNDECKENSMSILSDMMVHVMQYYSNVIDLNLSHNNFQDVPACLSCLMPKLLKLNLSFNKIQAMGSPNDYPLSLKHLDLSNNEIKSQMRLVNVDMLHLFHVNCDNKTLIRDYCFLSLINNQLNSENKPDPVTPPSTSVTNARNFFNNTQSQQQQAQQRNEQKTAILKQQHKRRSRSHSRNPRIIQQHSKDLAKVSASEPQQPQLQLLQQNFFDLFLLQNNLTILKLQKFTEKSYITTANIQMYQDKLCAHKKHMKLDNLKTLNLTNNKIVKFKIGLHLPISNLNEPVKSPASIASKLPASDSDSDTDDRQSRLKQPENNNNNQKIFKLFYPNLTHLDLSWNFVTVLNEHFSLLENLSYLNVASNATLTQISPRLGLLTKLWNFDLKNCTGLIDGNLNDMVNRQRVKTSEVLAYLKSIYENSKPYMKIKLMFVGVAGIGKTSLLNKIREETATANTPQSANAHQQTQYRSRFFTEPRTASTVGIDIGDWVYEKPLKSAQRTQYLIIQSQNQAKSFGPITFRTHDFAGQKEYYTTHQYFLSKRSLYLVCWKLTDEEKGINEIHSWLLNIQTRAPGSPCILIGTHHDQLCKLKNYKEISNFLQHTIYERFIKPNENENCAYPPIWASIEVSSKTGHNIKQLANIIYDVTCQMKVPGYKDQLLFEQKIPITYLILEECINYILSKMRIKARNPVLNRQEYLKEVKQTLDVYYTSIQVTKKLADLDKIRFRNDTEILQATQFLHEYGLIVHYNDSILRDLYFIDPQWLFDLLSSVVTIRELNPFASKGIMLISDLLVLFKGLMGLLRQRDPSNLSDTWGNGRFATTLAILVFFSSKASLDSFGHVRLITFWDFEGINLETSDITGFIVDLLAKFELALTWDNKHLIIPSLLPTEALIKFSNQDIRVQVLSNLLENSESKATTPPATADDDQTTVVTNRSRHGSLTDSVRMLQRCKSTDNFKIQSNTSLSISLPQSASTQFSCLDNKQAEPEAPLYECKPLIINPNEPQSIRRLYCLQFIPSGFFSRLITRVLSDKILNECLKELFELDVCMRREEQPQAEPFKKSNLKHAYWKCWQTGIELKYLDYSLICVKELLNDPLQMSYITTTQIKQNLFLQNSILYRDCENELKLKNFKQFSLIECYISYRNYQINENFLRIFCRKHICIRLMGLICEIIDNLLEDWYPDLGTRFMQDSKGEYLVTRLAPCIKCVYAAKMRTKILNEATNNQSGERSGQNEWNIVSLDEKFKIATVLDDSLSINEQSTLQQQQDDGDGAQDQQATTGIEDVETVKLLDGDTQWVYCFMLDDICHSVLKSVPLKCPLHGLQDAEQIAPDLAFRDLSKNFLIEQANLKFDKLLGRGSFGCVYSGHLQSTINKYDRLKIAIKTHETIPTAAQSKQLPPPPLPLPQAQYSEHESEQNFLNSRKSIRLCAKAYVLARQELAILSNLKHDNIVQFLGICIKPLSIILELAPLGNLKDTLNEYKSNLTYLSFQIVQEITIQISSALVYLHSNLIIYRDLKSDNILVWKFPKLNKYFTKTNNSLLIKLADYSISRCVLPTGTKGFAGTEGYMSPEIIRYNGEETYTDKIDCFSFGMVLYEVISLRHPFEGYEQIKDIILSGGRPLIRSQESTYPTLMLDLMCLCWSDNPLERPNSRDIHTYCKSYEFSHLLDVSVLEDYYHTEPPLCVTCYNKDVIYDTIYDEEDQIDYIDVWCVKNCVDDEESKLEIITYEYNQNFINTRKQMNVCSEKIDAICLYKKQVWCIDAMKCIYVFCAKTYSKLNQYLLTAISSDECIQTMLSVDSIDKIIVCTQTGIIVQINPLFQSLNEDLNFKLYQTRVCVKSAIIIPVRHDKSFELWLGSEYGQFYVYNLYTMKLFGIYYHNPTRGQMKPSGGDETNDYVTIIKTSQTDALFLWSYTYPSSKIYLWNHVAKVIMSSYDCKNISNDLARPVKSNRECRVVDLCFLNNYLHCATNTGSIIVLKRLTLTPIYMFDAHVKSLYTMCSITFELTTITQSSSTIGTTNTTTTGSVNLDDFSKFKRSLLPLTTTVKEQQHILITLGRALAPVHEDIYLTRSQYRFDALQNYENCLFLCAWNCNEDNS